MPYHTFANFVSVTGAADTDVTPVNDGILTQNNTHHIFGQDLWLHAAYAGSVNLQRCRYVTPHLRQIADLYIRPINLVLLPPDNASIFDLRGRPAYLKGQEEIKLVSDSSAGTQNHFVVNFAGDQSLSPWPAGDLYPLRWTATTTLTAAVWTLVPVTFESTIPTGQYNACFSEQWGVSAIAHRWTFDGQYFRPGMLSTALATSKAPLALYRGGFGIMGTFRNNTLPRLEVIANAGDTAEEGYLWSVKVA